MQAHPFPLLDERQLDGYLARIGQPRSTHPTLDALNALLAAQLDRIPFENVDVLLHRSIDIDLDAVFDKLVTRRRGGYCFEQNTLFAAALRGLGYDVTPLAARVRWNIDESIPTPQSHMLLRVRVDHRDYMIDAGFGGPNPPCALPLSGPAPDGLPYRLGSPPASAVAAGALHLFDLEMRHGDEWIKLYRFDLSPQPWIDFEPRNWHVCTHPASIFRHRLMAARTDGPVRLTLSNDELTERTLDGQTTHHRLETPHDVTAVLRDRFGLALDREDEAALQARLAEIMGMAGTR